MAAPPRPISGSIGSRIRLLLGSTGSDWLLLLHEDDGHSEWQTQSWTPHIPQGLAECLSNCISNKQYASNVDFGPTGAWYVHGVEKDGSRGYSWWEDTCQASAELESYARGPYECEVSFGSDSFGNESSVVILGRNGFDPSNIDGSLLSRMDHTHQTNQRIHFVRLFDNLGYYISDENGTDWDNLGEECSKELREEGTVEEIAKAQDGSFVVIRSDSFVGSRGVDADLLDRLGQFYKVQAARMQRRQEEIQNYHEKHQNQVMVNTERAVIVDAVQKAVPEADNKERPQQQVERQRVERQEDDDILSSATTPRQGTTTTRRNFFHLPLSAFGGATTASRSAAPPPKVLPTTPTTTSGPLRTTTLSRRPLSAEEQAAMDEWERAQQENRELEQVVEQERVDRAAAAAAERERTVALVAAEAEPERAEQVAEEAEENNKMKQQQGSPDRLARNALEQELAMALGRERTRYEERERELMAQVKSIRELELELLKRNRILKASIASLPPSRRVQFEANMSLMTPNNTIPGSDGAGAFCVVCRDEPAVRAVVPCGHLCLCDECAENVISLGSGMCPLCREDVKSTLKIFKH